MLEDIQTKLFVDVGRRYVSGYFTLDSCSASLSLQCGAVRGGGERYARRGWLHAAPTRPPPGRAGTELNRCYRRAARFLCKVCSMGGGRIPTKGRGGDWEGGEPPSPLQRGAACRYRCLFMVKLRSIFGVSMRTKR